MSVLNEGWDRIDGSYTVSGPACRRWYCKADPSLKMYVGGVGVDIYR